MVDLTIYKRYGNKVVSRNGAWSEVISETDTEITLKSPNVTWSDTGGPLCAGYVITGGIYECTIPKKFVKVIR